MFQISDNRRFLANADGAPFFWLGDTAWAVPQRLDKAETLEYLDDRAAKGFTVSQMVGLSEFDGLRVGNMGGEVPLVDLDPARPNPAFWAHVRWVCQEASARGITIALLPTWGDKWNKRDGVGPQIFTPDNAGAFGQWVGEYLRDVPLFWVLGGDRAIESSEQLETIRVMSAGLKAGDGSKHLQSFHPPGPFSSSKYLPDEAWLDFHMQQSGHSRPEISNAPLIEEDYARTPIKPVLDSEPRYEDHPIAWNWAEPDKWDKSNGYFDDLDARKAAYIALFAGAFGHTYGANSVFQCDKLGVFDGFGSRHTWRSALDLPGARHMGHARQLIESRAFFSRVPAQEILRGDLGEGSDQARATRDAQGSFALVYFPASQPIEVNTSVLAGQARASWFDPRTGQAHAFDSVAPSGWREFTSPEEGIDWVLALDVV